MAPAYLHSIVLVSWGTENPIDPRAPLGCLSLVQQKIRFLCPEASLHVYEPGYWASDSSESLGEESFNLLSELESCFEPPEGNRDMLWLKAQQEMIRPIIFIAHDIGGLLVENVSHAPI